MFTKYITGNTLMLGIVLAMMASLPASSATAGTFSISSVSRDPFDPPRHRLTVIRYTVPNYSKYRLCVLNRQQEEVAVLASVSRAYPSSSVRLWNGRDSQGRQVPDGAYSLKLTGESSSGEPIAPISKTIIVLSLQQPPYPLSLTSVTPNPFNARAGEQTVCTVLVPVSTSLRAQVTNSVGQMVRSLLPATPVEAGYIDITWDGSDDAGAIVADGAYTITVESTQTGRNAPTPANASVMVQTLAFTFLSIEPNRFNPVHDEETRVTVRVPVEAQWNVTISDTTGTLVNVLSPPEEMTPPGDYTLTWDGIDITGMKAQDGVYMLLAQGTTVDSRPVLSAGGQVRIKIPVAKPHDYGQTIEGVGSANYNWLQYPGTQFAVTLLAPRTGVISSITIPWRIAPGYGAGNLGSYTFELQESGLNDFPSGRVITRVEHIRPTRDDFLTVPITAAVQEGELYHCVVYNTDLNPDQNWSSPNIMMTRIHPWEGESGDAAAYSNGTWMPWTSRWNIFNPTQRNDLNGSHVAMLLEWQDGAISGDPYWSSAVRYGTAEIFGAMHAGEYIEWNGAEVQIAQVGLSVAKVGTPGQLVYHLEQEGVGEIASGVLATAADIDPTLPTWVYAALPAPVTLHPGQRYLVWFDSPDSPDNANCYRHFPVYGHGTHPLWLETGWGGTHSCYVVDTGEGWRQLTTHDATFSLR